MAARYLTFRFYYWYQLKYHQQTDIILKEDDVHYSLQVKRVLTSHYYTQYGIVFSTQDSVHDKWINSVHN